MSRALITFILILTVGLGAHCQFTYFNNVYEIDDHYTLQYAVFTEDSTYLSIGQYTALGEMGHLWRRVLPNGMEFTVDGQAHQYLYTGGNGSDRRVIKNEDGGYTICGARFDACGYAYLHLIKLNELLDTAWSRSFPNLLDCGYSDGLPYCIQNLDNGNILAVSKALYGYPNEVDSTGLHFTQVNLEGTLVFDTLAIYDQNEHYSVQGFRQTGPNELILWGVHGP